MKLDPLFKSENNSLYFLDGTSFPVSGAIAIEAKDCASLDAVNNLNKSNFYKISLPWSLVGLDEESYNEEFLANFREFLKACEEKKFFVFLVPVADVKPESEVQKEAYIQSMKHSARRIKDCASVIGYAVPEEVDSAVFIGELSAKHKQYIFFSSNDLLLKDKSIVRFS